MEATTTLRSTQEHDANLFDAVMKAVTQLNVWLMSIEDSIRSCLELTDSERIAKFEQLYAKMKLHQECLRRIVKICHDLSTRSNSEDMTLINEQILLVSDRFERIHEHVEMSLRLDDKSMVMNRCSTILKKIALYDNLVLSMCQEIDININNISDTDTLKNQVQNIKTIFNQFTEELESIKDKLKDTNAKNFDQFKSEIEGLCKSVQIIEDSIEDHWSNVSSMLRPYKIQSEISPTRFTESWDNAKSFSRDSMHHYLSITVTLEWLCRLPSADEVHQLQMSVSEIFLLNHEQYSTAINFIPESINWVCHSSYMNVESHSFTVEPLKIFTHTNIVHYLNRVITTHKLASCQELDPSQDPFCLYYSLLLSTTIVPQKISTSYNRHNTRNQPNLCNDSICSLPNNEYSTTVFKSAPHHDFLLMLNTSMSIIASPNSHTDENLHRHMLEFERSHVNIFERDYELLSDEVLSDSMVHMALIEDIQNKKNYDLPSTDIMKPFDQTTISPIMSFFQTIFSTDLLNEITTPMKYSNARAKLARPIIDFVVKNLQFDIGFGSILLVRNALYNFLDRLQFDQFIRSIGEVNQYRLIAAAV